MGQSTFFFTKLEGEGTPIGATQFGSLFFTPNFSGKGSHVSSVAAEGEWVAAWCKGSLQLTGSCFVDISADLVGEGFDVVLPDKFDVDLQISSGIALVTNGVARGLTVASPGQILGGSYNPSTRTFHVSFDSWDGGGVVANIRVQFQVYFGVLGKAIT